MSFTEKLFAMLSGLINKPKRISPEPQDQFLNKSTSMSSSAEKIEKACKVAITQAQPKSIGKCATYVRQAIEGGFGVTLERKPSAKYYGPCYEKIGFKKIFSYPAQEKLDYKQQIGDISIMQYEPHGHIALCTPNGWYSDFKQIDMWGSSKRKLGLPFDVYRFSV
jgi:hypothetical protein